MITSVVRVTLEGNRSPATIQGGPLATDTYELSEVVFRWGPSNCKGAEHTLNGTWFTMEAQAIHFNKRYETIERCWRENDGLAICSYFLQAYQIPTWDEHPSFSKITDDLYKITQYNSYAKIPASTLRISPPFFFLFPFSRSKNIIRGKGEREGGSGTIISLNSRRFSDWKNFGFSTLSIFLCIVDCLSWMRQACQTPGYYSYLGSLTTFPHYECATWIVFPEPVRISENQADLFRMLRNKEGRCIRDNYREVQKLNGRMVYYVN